MSRVRRLMTAGRPLLSPAMRRPAVVLAAAGVLVTVVPGILLAGQGQAGTVDGWIDGHLEARFNSQHIGDFAVLGSPKWVAAIVAVAVLACLLARRVRAALLVAIAVPLCGLLADHFLKELFDRRFGGSPTYPSGHTTAVAALALAAVVVLAGPSRPRLPAALRWALCAAVLAVVPVVAVALVIIHFHYFTDTVGGAGLSLTVVLLTALALDAAAAWLGARRRRGREPEQRQPDAGGISAHAGELPQA
jgi:undecaprenyl-diphosphatase